MQVMPDRSTIWTTPLFHMTQNNQYRPSPIILNQTVSFNSADNRPSTRGELATNIRAGIKHFRKELRTFGRRARQHHTKTSRIHESRRNAAGKTQRCTKRDIILPVAGRPRHWPSFLSHGLDRAVVCHVILVLSFRSHLL